MAQARRPGPQGLYDPSHEHDACGVGFVANVNGAASHTIVERGLRILQNLTHRGACGCDPSTGDGAGILVQIPDAFLRAACEPLDIVLPPRGEYGVGMVFLPEQIEERNECLELFEKVVREEGQRLLGWRRVPVDETKCGDLARRVMPEIRQIFIGRGRDVTDQAALERKLYVDTQARRAPRAQLEPARLGIVLRYRACRHGRSSTRACCCRTRFRPSTRT